MLPDRMMLPLFILGKMYDIRRRHKCMQGYRWRRCGLNTPTIQNVFGMEFVPRTFLDSLILKPGEGYVPYVVLEIDCCLAVFGGMLDELDSGGHGGNEQQDI